MTMTAPEGGRSSALDDLLRVMTAAPEPAPAPPAEEPETAPEQEEEEPPGWEQPEATPPAPPALVHSTLDKFFLEVIRPIYVRKVSSRGGRRWSAEWWRSHEALVRLEALWRSWEHLRGDPAMGMITWLREADYHMELLMNPEGPFAHSKDEAGVGQKLPHTAPPQGLFTPAQEMEDSR